MLLTIHNLPTNINYAELKTLIYNKCGISDTILDHLVNEGSTKKVTIGVADEGDAAILVRKINGLYLNGQHLYVEDVRKQRGSEKPYRSTPAINYQMPYYQTVPGYDQSTEKQNMNVMVQQPPVENYNMNQMDYCIPIDQNMSSMVYSNQNQSFSSKHTNYSEQAYGYETERVEDTHKGSMSSDRNTRRNNLRSRSPQQSQGRDQNFSKNSRWVVGDSVREKEIPQMRPRQSWNANPDRDQQNALRPPSDNYSNQKNAFRPLEDNYSDRRNPFGPSNNDYRDQRNDFRSSNDNYRDRENAFGPENDNYHSPQNAFRPSNDKYRDRGNDFGPSNVNNRNQENPFGPTNDNFRDRENAFGPSNDDYRDQQDSFRLPIDDFHGRASVKDIGGNFGQQIAYDTDYETANQGRGFKPMDINLYETNIYGDHVTESQVPSLVPNRWEHKDEVQKKRFDSSHKLDVGPQSYHPYKKYSDRIEKASGFGKNPSRFNRNTVSPFRGSVPNRKSFQNRGGEPKLTTSRSERNPFPQSERKLIPGRNRKHNADDRDTGFTKKRFEPDTHAIQSMKFEKSEAKFSNDPEGNIIKTINKDQTWRGQAASSIAKQMMQKFSKGKNPRFLQQLKLSIRTRIDVLLGERFSVPPEEIVELYRKQFRYKTDKEFYYAVEETVKNAKIELQKLYENASERNFAAKDGTPNKQETVTNVSEDSSVTKKQPPLVKAPIKQQTPKDVPNAPNLTLDQNLSGKALGKAQKKIATLEYQGGQVYTLPVAQQDALDKEMHTFVNIFKKECAHPEKDYEEKICDQISGVVAEDFKKVVSLNITKRILDVRTGLSLRVLGSPKPPKKASLLEFLSHYGGVSVNKADAKKIFTITLDSYEKYDELCGLGSVLIDDISVKFSPIHITGPPQKISRAEILKKRTEWIENQIDKTMERNKNKHDAGQDNLEVAQVQDSKSRPKTDDDNVEGDISEVNDVKNNDHINEECFILDHEDKTGVIDLDADDYVPTIDDTTFAELLEAEVDENDFEDY